MHNRETGAATWAGVVHESVGATSTAVAKATAASYQKRIGTVPATATPFWFHPTSSSHQNRFPFREPDPCKAGLGQAVQIRAQSSEKSCQQCTRVRPNLSVTSEDATPECCNCNYTKYDLQDQPPGGRFEGFFLRQSPLGCC